MRLIARLSPKEWPLYAPHCPSFSQRIALVCASWPTFSQRMALVCASWSITSLIHPGYTHRCAHTPYTTLGIPTVVHIPFIPPWVYLPLYTLRYQPGYTHRCTP